MATRTPQRDDSSATTGNSLDKEWVTEHARQVGKEGQSSNPVHIHVAFSIKMST